MFNWIRPQNQLDERSVDKGLHNLLYEGVFGQVMLVLTMGPFVVAYALHLGASNKTIGLLAAVGPMAQIVQIPAIYLLERIRMRKLLVTLAGGLSRASLLIVAMVPLFVPTRLRLAAILILLCAHFGIGAIAQCAYNSWFRDVIPEQRMASFLASRLTWATLVGALISFLGGAALDFVKTHMDPTLAYSALFAIGGTSGLTALCFLARTPEPVMPRAEHASLTSLLTEPLRDGRYRPLLVFLGWWVFAVNFAAPFFAVYLISRLGLSMTWVLTLSVTSQLFNVLFFGLWGRLSERFGNKAVLTLCVPLFFCTFLLWPFTTMPERHAFTLPILFGIHIIAGIATAGVALCASNLTLKAAPYGKGAAYLAVNSLVSGLAATIAPLFAGFAADAFEPYQLKLTLSFLNWRTEQTNLALRTLDLKGLDFVFLAAFAFGLYCSHRLLAVKEEGLVEDRATRQAFFGEMRRMVRQVSTVAGMRQVMAFPFIYLTTRATRTFRSAAKTLPVPAQDTEQRQ